MCDYKQLYAPIVKLDSRNAVQLGQALGGKWGQFLEDEGRHNTQNPGRGLTKVAESAALWYLGGAAGGALGGAGGAAADAAGSAGTMTAEQAAALAAQDAAESGGTLALNAAGNAAAPVGNGLLQAAPQGLGNTLDATLQNTGYTPSSLLNAAKNANIGNGTPLTQNVSNYVQQQGQQLMNGGLLNRVSANLSDPKSGAQMQLAKSLMTPQQQQPMPQAPPPRQQQYQPLPTPYSTNTNSANASLPPPGMTMEEWLRLKQQRVGLLGGQY